MSDGPSSFLDQARAGDSAALSRFLEDQLPGLARYVRKQAGKELLRRESVDDLVQSACREVVAKLDEFDAETGGEREFRNWLYWNALRKILERQRFHARYKRDIKRETPLASDGSHAVALADLYKTSATPSQKAIGAEEQRMVEIALDRLPPHYSLVIKLAYFEGLPRAEIADIMGRSSANAVQVLLSRALARLAVLLDAERSRSNEAG